MKIFDEITVLRLLIFALVCRYWLKVLSEHLPDLVDTVTVISYHIRNTYLPSVVYILLYGALTHALLLFYEYGYRLLQVKEELRMRKGVVMLLLVPSLLIWQGLVS